MKKILAVIPARAGSKGIPNKNIRILGGHPMVWYAIDNAQRSEYITDTVVTTDSTAVAMIAKKMGVDCRWRSKELCEDHVTLDRVVYDAIPDGEKWDYIITMQPTSPLLKRETLDQAIRYAMDGDYDTVIAVINRPHLFWKKDPDGKILPGYEERKNRQYLPAHYMETGAFVIAKAEVVRPDTRFGNKVGVFELEESEAVDVDSYEDLKYISDYMDKRSIAIYVNGNLQRGMGHVCRALELADEFYVSPDIYYDVNQTDPAVFGKTTHHLQGVNGIAELYRICEEKSYDIFINDILDTSIDYMIGLRTVLPRARIINFEDEGEGAGKADLVINALLSQRNADNVYIGEKYYLANKVFLFYQPITIKDRVQSVFICFGGADPQNYTEQILKIVSKDEYKDIHFVVALGKAKQNIEELMKYNERENFEVYYDVENMPELMSGCDMAFTARGRTAYELALLGIPTIAMSQNERERNHAFACNENGFTYIGLQPADEVIEANLKMYLSLSAEARSQYQKRMLSHELREGRRYIMDLIRRL